MDWLRKAGRSCSGKVSIAPMIDSPARIRSTQRVWSGSHVKPSTTGSPR